MTDLSASWRSAQIVRTKEKVCTYASSWDRFITLTCSFPFWRTFSRIHLCPLRCCARVATIRLHHPIGSVSAGSVVHLQAQGIPLFPLRVSSPRLRTVRYLVSLELTSVCAISSISSTWSGCGSFRSPHRSLSHRICLLWVSPVFKLGNVQQVDLQDPLRAQSSPGATRLSFTRWTRSSVFSSICMY